MRFSPDDIRHQPFERGFRGLSEEQVREFLDVLAREFDAMQREIVHLQQKADEQAEELREFRRRERSLLDALNTAKEVAEEMRSSAREEADRILEDARLESRELLARAREKRSLLRQQNYDLMQQRAQFQAELEHILSSHRKLLEVFEPEERAHPPAPPTTPEASGGRGAASSSMETEAVEVDEDAIEESYDEIDAAGDTMMGIGDFDGGSVEAQ